MAAIEAVGGRAYNRFTRRHAVGHHVEEAANAGAEEEQEGHRQDNLQLNTNLSKSFNLTGNKGLNDIVCGSLEGRSIPGHTHDHTL